MQLCVSDVVEDLMEGMSLNAESEKSSQESETQHSVGLAAENLQGEKEADLSTLQMKDVSEPKITPAAEEPPIPYYTADYTGFPAGFKSVACPGIK